MDLTWTPDQLALSERAREVAADGTRAFGAYNDAWMNGFSRDFSRKLAQLGWIGLTWPTEFGGGGHAPVDRLLISEAMLDAGAPVAATWFADRQIGPSLIAYGTDDQRARFLPGILAGESTWCIGMSEPGAGSDVASLRTTARRDGDTYIVDGQKIWTSFAASADFCYLICRTGDGISGHLGISELIVPMDLPGITIRPIWDLAGGQHFCEVFFDAVSVPGENLVGIEGEAFSQTMRQLEHERGGIDRLFSNRILYRTALAAADTSDPRVLSQIAQLEVDYTAGRLMVIREALRQGPPGFSAVTKLFCTSHEQRVAQFAWETLGMSALLWDAVGRGLAYSPSYGIMGGTNEVLRNIIGERMLGLPREPVPRGELNVGYTSGVTTKTPDAPQLGRVLVVGGGTMGSGIVQALLEHGATVTLQEIDEGRAAAARELVHGGLAKWANHAGVDSDTLASVRARLTTGSAGLDDVPDLVIETVPERLALKQQVLSDLGLRYPHALLATNTSALSIDALAVGVEDPSRFAGLHFFNPVPRSGLIEIVRGAQTSARTLERFHEISDALGKASIEVRDAPGFATSRLGIAIGLEAIRMVEEDVASVEDIDAGMVHGYKFPIGPLALSDMVGLDIRLAIADHLRAELGERFAAPDLLRRMVAAGELGQKAGRGFYEWNEKGRVTRHGHRAT